MNDSDRVALKSAATAIVGLTLVLICLGITAEPPPRFRAFKFLPDSVQASHTSIPKLTFRSFRPLPTPRSISRFYSQNLEIAPRHGITGQWLLGVFGHAHCPDVCRQMIGKLAQVTARMAKEKSRAVPLVLLISIDPERDSPEALERYVRRFGDGVFAVRGSNAAIAEVARFFGVEYSRFYTIEGKGYRIEAGADMPAAAGRDYEVTSSSPVVVVNPHGDHIGSFAPDTDPEALYQDLKNMVDNWN